MTMGGDIISDYAIGQAQINAAQWRVHAQELEAAKAHLEAENARLQQENQTLGEAAAGNLAWRYQLMDQLKAIDPWNPVLEDQSHLEWLVDNAKRIYSIRRNFDDVRNFAKCYFPHTADFEGKSLVGRQRGQNITRDEYIHYAKVGSKWAAFEKLLGEPYTLRTAAWKSRYFAERLPDLLIKIAGDTEHPIFSKESDRWMEEWAGNSYDQLVASGELEDDPKLRPIEKAINLGACSPYLESPLGTDGLRIQNGDNHYRPPEKLLKPFPDQEDDPPSIIP